jgi:REP element-mobilizing transposase RayT
MKTRYRNRLPHIQPVGGSFFITFRLYNSLSKQLLKKIQREAEEEKFCLLSMADDEERRKLETDLRQRYFNLLEKELEKGSGGNHWLSDQQVANIVQEELFKWDGIYYDLLCFTIMSNHVHMVIDTSVQLLNEEVYLDIENNYVQLDQILKRIKGSTACRCNRVLSRSGQFWDRESWDVLIRNQRMLQNVITYTLENSVKAGLVKCWRDYKWSYWKDG